MRLLLIVFLGGGIGSIARYLIAKVITQSFESTFPLGNLVVNLVGCFIIGVVLTFPEKYGTISPQWKLFLATGFCGGFTTFSAFAYENNTLIQNREVFYFILYTTLSVLLGLISTYIGIVLMRRII